MGIDPVSTPIADPGRQLTAAGVGGASAATRRGRPPGTSARALEIIALELFSTHGFDETTIDQIAAAAGVSKRTFFRYFESKTDVLWNAFDLEVDNIRRVLAEMPEDLPVIESVRRAVLSVNHYGAQDVPELRTRMNLIGTVPELGASAALHYDAWEDAVTDFVAQRTTQAPDSLFPRTVGCVTLAACRAAYEQWASRADADLTVYLDAALRGLAAGFSDTFLSRDARAADPLLAGRAATLATIDLK